MNAGRRRNACFAPALTAVLVAFQGCSVNGAQPESASATRPAEVVIESPPGTSKPPYQWSDEDAKFLDEVQRAAFGFMWKAANEQTGMVPDRSSKPIVSVAGVGFELSSLCIGVERGWITRQQGQDRANLILDSLARDPSIRHQGVFQHFLDSTTAGPHTDQGLEHVASTIDTGLLFGGMIVASSYFGGEIATKADAFITEANWRAYVSGNEAKPHERGFISLGWKPKDTLDLAGPGGYLPYYWVDSGCEHRLVTFLAACAPKDEYRVDPALYYKLRRQLGSYKDSGVLSWFPWSGALFTFTFSHCFIDYAHMGPDNPSAFGASHRASIDWWENSRRAVKLHRIKCEENPKQLPTFSKDAWGLSASDYPKGYLVAGVYPDLLPMPGARPDFDFDTFRPKDEFGDGTLAPYAAGCAIMFDPEASLRAMRHYRSLKASDGSLLAWRDPANGGYGFVDSFNLAGPGGKPWAAPDTLAIDHGPLLVSIENARTGLIWKLFHAHPFVKDGMKRLGLKRTDAGDRSQSDR